MNRATKNFLSEISVSNKQARTHRPHSNVEESSGVVRHGASAPVGNGSKKCGVMWWIVFWSALNG